MFHDVYILVCIRHRLGNLGFVILLSIFVHIPTHARTLKRATCSACMNIYERITKAEYFSSYEILGQ